MILTTLKEEARAEFENSVKRLNGLNPVPANYLSSRESIIDSFIDSIIDRTYHTTKEEVRGIVEAIINDTKMEYITQKDVLTYQGKPLSTLLGSEKNYVSAVDLDAMLQKILSALEDTTTSPDVS